MLLLEQKNNRLCKDSAFPEHPFKSNLTKKKQNLIAAETRLACGGEYSPNDATQSHQELPQRHVLLTDCHHQRAGVILQEDARHAVAACSMVYHPLLQNERPGGWVFRPFWVLLVNSFYLLTLSVTENWCVSADTVYVFSLVGTTVMKYWNIWLSVVKHGIMCERYQSWSNLK